ncbi:NAD-dependent epimerase/dehydratase family protein [Kitasatospora acidiphila]|uniref:NAD-dependent epimerase/dehydratase family protein n=1 Tax=Kitasatospora acidiphila TaxID=2567942 RepID=A0A540W7I0_9ACTN|nr:NAD(P)H-binding protein [Kitasatospora acidiphila]TQF04887.1 NAD-dependent epimerase/dehydratase family protein [Kitasatospora acidiphila]
MDSPIAVIGGNGRIGRLVVDKLLDRGERVRVLGRGPRAARRAGEVEYFRADVRDPGTLAAPLAGLSALVFSVEPGTSDSGPDSPEATMHRGVLSALAAATADGSRPHVALVSQIYVTRKSHSMNSYGRLLDWRLAGEDAVRGSGLPYTVVRPSWLTDRHAAGSQVRLEQGDTGEGKICRDDVAEALVNALYLPEGSGLTFEIYNESGSAASDWPRLFGALRHDSAAVAR